jgi:hypothetical protein
MPRKKSQIALEYMIVFSFVLVVFTFLFATVATQRIQAQNGQLFSEEQLIAQNIAAQLDRALQGGSGYVAYVPVATAIGSVNYQLNITKNGAVIVSTNIGGEAVQAVAYSSVKDVVSNSSFIPSGFPTYYSLPIVNGTLAIQNSFGTVCVDYQCPVAGGQATAVGISSEVTHAGNFNGQTTYINAGSGNSLNVATGGSVTMCAWVYPASTASSTTQAIIAKRGVASYPYAINFVGSTNTINVFTSGSSGIASFTYGFQKNKWTFLCGVISSAPTALYINGANLANSGGGGGVTANAVESLTLGSDYGPTEFFNGSLANVQLYNAALSANQVMQLYSEGISGAPLASANTIGWWPLNGNSQDYSGNGNNGNFIGPLTYTTAAQLFAKATNMYGQPLSNALVGFETTFGNFTTGQVAVNYTNANGIATAFLSQRGNNGQALVKATAFNSNSAIQGSLVGWWPLNLGQGATAPDLSGNNNNGAMGSASWSDPNYAAKFDGQTSYVSTGMAGFPSGSAARSAFAWVYYTGTSPAIYQPICSYGSYVTNEMSGVELSGNNIAFVAGSSNPQSSFTAVPNTWNFVGYAYSSGSSQVTIYFDGQSQVLTLPQGALNTVNSWSDIGAHDNALADGMFSGQISDVQYYSTAISASQAWTLYQEGISGPPVTTAGLVGWWPLDGDAKDYSGSGNNGVIYGNLNFAGPSSAAAANSTVTSAFIGSFNGASSYASVSGNLVSGGNWTASVWASVNTVAPTVQYPLSMSIGSGGLGTGIFMAFNSVNGDWGFYDGANSLYGTATVPNQWYLLAVVKSGTTYTLYANGKAVNSLAMGSVPINSLSIGRRSDGLWPLSGSIAGVQVYGAALSANQMQSIYQRGISGTPLAGAGLVGWWPLDGSSNDVSGNGNNATAANVAYAPVSASNPHLLNSLGPFGAEFNGQTSNVVVSQNAIVTGNQITEVAWADELGPGNIGTRGLLVSQPYLTFIDACYPTNTPAFVVYTSPSTAAGAYGGSCPTYGVWRQYAGTYNGSALDLYINGVQVGTAALTGNLDTSPGVTAIGGSSGGSYNFNGVIADVQIYNTALNSSQVQQLYQSQMPPTTSAAVPLGWIP